MGTILSGTVSHHYYTSVQWQPETPGPASFHFFECLDNDPAHRFDYLDDLFTPILAMRMGSIGVVCVLQDWGRSEGVQEPHLVGARTVQLHPTQFREVYGRLNYMTKVSWRNLVHPVIGGEGTATVVAASPGEFAGSFDVEEFSTFMSTIWQVPVETIFKNGVGSSTIFDESGNPFSATTQNLVFSAPYGDTGLWPGHVLTLSLDGTQID